MKLVGWEGGREHSAIGGEGEQRRREKADRRRGKRGRGMKTTGRDDKGAQGREDEPTAVEKKRQKRTGDKGAAVESAVWATDVAGDRNA